MAQLSVYFSKVSQAYGILKNPQIYERRYLKDDMRLATVSKKISVVTALCSAGTSLYSAIYISPYIACGLAVVALVAVVAAWRFSQFAKKSALYCEIMKKFADDKEFTKQFHELLQNHPKQEREELLSALVTLFYTVTGNKTIFFDAFNSVPQKERMISIKFLLPYAKEGDFTSLARLLEIPKEQRPAVMKAATPFLKGVKKGNLQAEIIYQVYLLLKGNKKRVLENIKPFVQGNYDGSDFGEIIKVIPSTGLKPFQKLAEPHLKEVAEGNKRVQILNLMKLPPKTRDSYLHLINKFPASVDFIDLIDKVQRGLLHFKHPLPELLTWAFPILKSCKWWNEVTLLQEIDKLSDQEREPVISLTSRFLDHMERLPRKFNVLKLSSQLHQKGQSYDLDWTMPYLGKTAADNILENIKECFALHQANLLSQLLSLFGKAEDFTRLLSIENIQNIQEPLKIIENYLLKIPDQSIRLSLYFEFAKISDKEREEVLEILKLILSTEFPFQHLSALCVVLLQSPKERRKQVLTALLRLVDGLSNIEKVEALCLKLDPLKPDHLFSAAPFISPFDTEEEREKILELVKKCDPKDLEIVKKRLPMIKSAKQLIATFETLPKFSEDKREKIASGLILCLQDDSTIVDFLIQSVDTLIEANSLLPFLHRGHRSVLKALQNVSSADRVVVMQRVRTVLGGLEEGEELSLIIEFIAKFPKCSDETLKALLSLFDEIHEESSRTFGVVHQLFNNDKSYVLLKALPLLKLMKSGKHRLLEKLSGETEEQVSRLVQMIIPFTDKDNLILPRLDSLLAISDVTEREDVFLYSSAFLSPKEFSDIISKVHEIDKAQRADVIKQISFFKTQLKLGGISHVIDCFRMLSPEQLALVQRGKAKPFLRGITDGLGLLRMLSELVGIQESELEELKSVEKIITKISSGSTRKDTLKTLRTIERNHRTQIVQLVEPHLNRIADHCVSYVLCGLYYCPDNLRDENVKRLIALFQGCDEKTANQIYYAWYAQEPNAMVELLKLVQPILIEQFEPTTRPTLIKGIREIPSDRESVLKTVIPVLEEIQDADHFAKLVKCLALFKEQEREQARDLLIPLLQKDIAKSEYYHQQLEKAQTKNRMQVLVSL